MGLIIIHFHGILIVVMIVFRKHLMYTLRLSLVTDFGSVWAGKPFK